LLAIGAVAGTITLKNREQARSHKALVPSTATATAKLAVIGISARLFSSLAGR
jgi:hypothetical protein